MTITLHDGKCLDWLPLVPDASVDCVITDPPYPCIDRPYGKLTEAEWWTLIVDGVVPQVRRILKPTGSAVFILQPNSRKVGSMRGWLWEFMAWACREWNMVQDAWWWNIEALPLTRNQPNMLRPSLKACVWLGPVDCYCNSTGVLWRESDGNRTMRLSVRCDNDLERRPSRATIRNERARNACVQRGGVTPFNVVPMGHDAAKSQSTSIHGASTPLRLASWWTRYLCPPGGTCCDPFLGSGTMALAAIKHGASFIGGDKMPEYMDIARRRIAEAMAEQPLFAEAAP